MTAFFPSFLPTPRSDPLLAINSTSHFVAPHSRSAPALALAVASAAAMPQPSIALDLCGGFEGEHPRIEAESSGPWVPMGATDSEQIAVDRRRRLQQQHQQGHDSHDSQEQSARKQQEE